MSYNMTADVQTALAALFDAGAVFELRVPDTRYGVVSGYFDDFAKAAKAATEWNGKGPGVYVTVNVLDPATLARAANRMQQHAKKTTAERDIKRRWWLVVDLDPQRPSGVCATDGEHAAAEERAHHIRAKLTERGWPEPVVMDSGNGAYLLYRVDLPHDATTTQLVAECTQALDFLFSDAVITVDTAVGKAAQLVRVPGTLNAKGDNVPDRPHRVVRLLEVPQPLDPVPQDLLDQLAATLPRSPKTRRTSQTAVNVETWIAEHRLAIARTKPWNGGTVYELETCPWDPDHRRTARVVQLANGALSAGCFHAGCAGKSWADLRDARGADGSGDEPRRNRGGAAKASQAALLAELAADLELFHSDDGDIGYATVPVNAHRETWKIKAASFRRWLVRRFYEEYAKPPGSQALTDAIALLESRAQFDGPRHPVLLRVGGDAESVVYLDLANENWEVVEITAARWRIVTEPPIKFERTRGMLALPRPIAGGALNLLRPYVNLPGDDDWLLFISWLVGGLRPKGPYPVLTVYGGHGSAKSTLSQVARKLVDPNTSPLRSEPSDVRDVMIAARNGWMLTFDNLSYLPPWLSDALCRLATGGGLSTRELYTDTDETLFFAQRPMLVNGIEEMVTRPDLVDRALTLHLPPIDTKKRRAEKGFWRDFEAVQPAILGALCDAVGTALRRQPDLKLDALPRLADFAVWAAAAEPALGSGPGTFLRVYMTNSAAGHGVALEASPVAQATLKVAAAGRFEGTASELLQKLDALVDDHVKRDKVWPKDAQALSNRLRRLAPSLGAQGILVDWDRTASRRLIILDNVVTTVTPVTNPAGDTKTAEASSAASQPKYGKASPNDTRDACDDPNREFSESSEKSSPPPASDSPSLRAVPF